MEKRPINHYYREILIAILIIFLFIKHCGNGHQSPAPMQTNNAQSMRKQIRGLIAANKELKKRSEKAEQNSIERDTIYVTRVQKIKEIAPAECDTFIRMVVQECDTLIITKEVEIAVKDSIMVVDSTIIATQREVIKKHRRQKILAIGAGILLFTLAVLR